MGFIHLQAAGRSVFTRKRDSSSWLQFGLPILAVGFLGLGLAGCGSGSSAKLVIEPDDGRAPILQSIAGARDNVRLTIYEMTDLQSVSQSPTAPPNGIAQALIDKAQSGVSVRVVVDQAQYSLSSTNGPQIQATVAALRNAGVVVHPSSTAFCYTHQKTLVIDGPTPAKFWAGGEAIIMSFNLMPSYFGGSRDYAVITSDRDVVQEISSVFDADFDLLNPTVGCSFEYSPSATYPPFASDTPTLSENNLVWSPVNSKPKLIQLIGSATKSLDLTTEELQEPDTVCQIQAVAQSSTKPTVHILLAGDTGVNAAAVKTLMGLGLTNLTIRIMPGISSPPTPQQTPIYMHGKQVIADASRAFVGSENITKNSLVRNRELGIIFHDQAMIQRLQQTFTSDFTTAGSSLPAQACSSGSSCYTITCP